LLRERSKLADESWEKNFGVKPQPVSDADGRNGLEAVQTLNELAENYL
jgi:hypothetical protein